MLGAACFSLRGNRRSLALPPASYAGYQEYCTEQFGRAIHHKPTGAGSAGEGPLLAESGTNNENVYRRTRSMAEREFGTLDLSIWHRLGEGAGCKEGACTGECDTDCHGDCKN